MISPRAVSTRATLGLASGVCLLSLVGTAHAQTWGYDDRRPYESRQNFAVELRGGGWVAGVDREFNGAATPYKDIFGEDLRPHFGAEFDWQIVRIGPVLSLGVGAQAGFSTITAPSPLESETMNPAIPPSMWMRSTASVTGLQVIPTSLFAVARFDILARRVKYLPLVFTLKGGLAYSFWWITNGTGLARVQNEGDAVGGSLGYQISGGVQLMLDAFEPSLARQLDASQGINHTYAFFEVTYSDMPSIGARKQLNLGALFWTVGLTFEF